MTPDKLREAAAVMLAAAEGKRVEVQRTDIPDDGWLQASRPCWDWATFDYRIAPEPWEGWGNVYPDGVAAHASREEAERYLKANGRTIKVREVKE